MNEVGGRASLAATILLGLGILFGGPEDARGQSHPSAAGAVTRSLILPGWGQLALGQSRGWVYAALEAGAWTLWVQRRSRGDELRDRYRDSAWASGRIASGPRVDGDFAYYEALTKWGRSGGFDRDPGLEGVQPEVDATTYNGAIWSRAQDLFIPPGTQPGPDDLPYRRALSYYEDHAYDARFLWDWTGREGDLQEFRRLVSASDGRFRAATTAFGAVLANHVLSGVDAYLSASIRANAQARVLPGRGGRWTLLFRVGAAR